MPLKPLREGHWRILSLNQIIVIMHNRRN